MPEAPPDRPTDAPVEGSSFLPLGAAAARLGVSRLRLRQAIAAGRVPARRDNRGEWRVDLDGLRGGLPPGGADDPETLIHTLFDEIEALDATVQEREALLAAATSLATRQAAALDRLEAALDASETRADRLASLLDRAIAAADAGTRPAPPEPAAERALALLEAAAGDLERTRAENARLAELLARATGLAEAAEGSAEARVAALSATTERAMALLDRVSGELARAEGDGQRLAGLLDRALGASHALARDAEMKAEVIAGQDRIVDRLFSISERTVDMAARGLAPRRRGFFGRLLGRA